MLRKARTAHQPAMALSDEGALRRRSRSKLRSVETDRNVEQRRHHRRLRQRRILDTRRWLRKQLALLSLDLPPDFVCGLSNPTFGHEFTRHRRQHVLILRERLQPF